MPIDLGSETVVPFTPEGTEGLFPGYQKVSAPTLHRWRKHGVRGVKIETEMVGGRRHTSEEAIKRFIEAQRETPMAAPAVKPQTESAKQRRSAAVNSELKKLGMK